MQTTDPILTLLAEKFHAELSMKKSFVTSEPDCAYA